MRQMVILLALLAATAAGFGCKKVMHAKKQDPVLEIVKKWQRGRSRQALEGEDLYKRYCAVCHGEAADGNGFNASLLDPKPADLIPLAVPAHRELVLKVISDGSAAAGKSDLCPPWNKVLTGEQRQAIFEHLQFLATTPAKK